LLILADIWELNSELFADIEKGSSLRLVRDV